MAAVFESDGYSIDIEAVKDQLRILGHEVSDDVIVNFIKQVYLPQRTSQSGDAHAGAHLVACYSAVSATV
jgi:hypothetical protein